MKLEIEKSLIILGLVTVLLPITGYANQSVAGQDVRPLATPTQSVFDANQKTEARLDVTSMQRNGLSVEDSKLKRLAEHPQWHHLLFYKKGKAEVISDGFYLSDPTADLAQSFSPYNELIATLNQKDNDTIVCQFPARYYWLNVHIEELNVDLSACAALPDPNQSISLILVSDYLKNPASSFGHVLVKTNEPTALFANEATDNGLSNEELLTSEDLLNSTYNFGARIPENENGLMYAMKGLFGVYDAGFAEAEFFKQDAVYSKNEQRDMWEYKLNLNTYQTQLLNYHLYEAKSARFDYYFIKQNCGYRSGEILELISDVKMTERLGPWYAPNYVFNQVVEHDTEASTQLIESVRYLPSEQTQLRHKFVQLPKPIQRKINQIITAFDKQSSTNLEVLDSLPKEQRALALDFLILHRTYKISQKNTPENQDFKKQLISERFNLPVNDTLAKLSVPQKPSPALSNKTTKTEVTLIDDAAQLGLSLFVKDPLNNHTDINKRFEAVKTTVDYNFDDNEWVLADFVFIDMQQIENLAQPLAGEPKLSWQLNTGARLDPFNGNHHRPYLQGGLGAGLAVTENILGYSMINLTAHDQHGKIDTGVEIGVRAKRNGQAVEFGYNLIERKDENAVSSATVTLRQQLTKNDDARLWISHNENNIPGKEGMSVGVTWHHYW